MTSIASVVNCEVTSGGNPWRPCRARGGIKHHRASGGGVADCTVAHAMGRYTRIACAAIVALVLLGDNTAAMSSMQAELAVGHERGPSLECRGNRLGFVGSSCAALASRTSFQQRKASLFAVLEARRSRAAGVRGPSSIDKSAASEVREPPAFAFSVKSRQGMDPEQQRGMQRLLFASSGTDNVGGRDAPQSPRFAAADGGRSYPERLQVSAMPITDSASVPGAEDGTMFRSGSSESIMVHPAQPSLPELDEEDMALLFAGERVQKQTRQGGSGSGSVVVDVRADPDTVMGLITNYRAYADMIDTVRQCQVFPIESKDPDTQKVEVTVSRFRLHIRVVMTHLRDRNMVKFELDPDCTKAGRAVLREATGFFYVESPPDRPGYSRIWMMATVDVNRFVPGAIVDYAAGRALPRASTWIKPTCEAAQRRRARGSAA